MAKKTAKVQVTREMAREAVEKLMKKKIREGLKKLRKLKIDPSLDNKTWRKK